MDVTGVNVRKCEKMYDKQGIKDTKTGNCINQKRNTNQHKNDSRHQPKGDKETQEEQDVNGGLASRKDRLQNITGSKLCRDKQ